MIQKYLLAGLRYLIKRRNYTLMNMAGLSIGLACFALIGLWVRHETSYDRFHPKADRVFRVGGRFTDGSGSFDQAVTPPPLGPALLAEYPEIEETVRIDKNSVTVHSGDKQFIEPGVLVVDAAFFSMFNYPLLSGNPATALNEPYALIVTETMAQKYFGSTDVIGKTLTLFLFDPDGNGHEYMITAVAQDPPLNAHFHFNFLASFKTLEVVEPDALGPDGWYWNGYYTYLTLKEGTTSAALQAKLPGLIEKFMGKNNREWKISYDYFLTSLPDIHLKSHLRYELEPTGSVAYVVIFGLIGGLVLVLACINYINLSTSFSADRFKDVGIRKTMGALRSQLVGQYLAESWLLAMVSLLIAFLWMELARPLFESLTEIPVTGLYDLKTILTLVTIASVAGLLSGLYPAFLLSGFRPSLLLKGMAHTGSSRQWMRKMMVGLQFATSFILVMGILVVQLQFRFMKNKDLGWDHEQLLVLGVNGSREVIRGYEGFRNELLSSRAATHVARANSSITGGLGNSVADMETAGGEMLNATVYRLRVDYEYLETYRMKLLAGRFLSRDFPSDSTKGYVVNEALIKNFGYSRPDDAIGKRFSFGGNEGTVVGVLGDFHYTSLQRVVEPACMFLLGGNFSRIILRVPDSSPETLSQVATLWQKYFPASVFDPAYADDAIAGQYRAEERFSRVFEVFSGISLAIACLGLFALVSYSVENRRKEISIRKVLGASLAQILGTLSREFILLIIIASVVAVPLGYYLMQEWLNGFAYRMELNPLVIVASIALVTLLAMLTVSVRSLSAAKANPADSLRSE